MCAGNRPEGKNEGGRHSAGGERIGEKGNCDVAPGEPFTRDAGTCDSGQQ